MNTHLTEQQQADLLSGFGPWVASQPKDGEYHYGDAHSCAFQRYLVAMGYPHAVVGIFDYFLDDAKRETSEYRLPRDIDWAVHGTPRTFGALADRLRAVGWLGRDASKPVNYERSRNANLLTAGML